MGSIVYRPIFASGASTVSPLFRILDSVKGTLVLDEGDFRFSDEKADIVKILNNGNSTGFPVLRTETTPSGEFNPRAFEVFGPKILATRREFDDPALESRCITACLGGKPRPGIPLSLPPEFHEEALSLRNALLTYRLRTQGETAADPEGLEFLEPRIAQVFGSLLASVEDPAARERLLGFAHDASAKLLLMRGDSVEADVIAAMLGLRESYPGAQSVKAIARELSLGENGAPLSPRAVGAVLRRLGFSPRKRQGNYVVTAEEIPKLLALAKRYGTDLPVDIVDVVDEESHAPKEEVTLF